MEAISSWANSSMSASESISWKPPPRSSMAATYSAAFLASATLGGVLLGEAVVLLLIGEHCRIAHLGLQLVIGLDDLLELLFHISFLHGCFLCVKRCGLVSARKAQLCIVAEGAPTNAPFGERPWRKADPTMAPRPSRQHRGMARRRVRKARTHQPFCPKADEDPLPPQTH